MGNLYILWYFIYSGKWCTCILYSIVYTVVLYILWQVVYIYAVFHGIPFVDLWVTCIYCGTLYTLASGVHVHDVPFGDLWVTCCSVLHGIATF